MSALVLDLLLTGPGKFTKKSSWHVIVLGVGCTSHTVKVETLTYGLPMTITFGFRSSAAKPPLRAAQGPRGVWIRVCLESKVKPNKMAS